MPNDNKAQIIIATLGLVGVLGAALFGNWDKLIGPDNENLESSTSPTTPGTAQTITGNNNIQVSGSNNVLNHVLQAPELIAEYGNGRMEISNQGQGTIVVSNLTLNWTYKKCPRLEPMDFGAPMITYNYTVFLTASDGSEQFETRDFKYGPGEIDRFEIDYIFEKKGLYTTWLTFDYRVPGIDDVSKFISSKDTLSECEEDIYSKAN